jgi:hypothetical protein
MGWTRRARIVVGYSASDQSYSQPTKDRAPFYSDSADFAFLPGALGTRIVHIRADLGRSRGFRPATPATQSVSRQTEEDSSSTAPTYSG